MMSISEFSEKIGLHMLYESSPMEMIHIACEIPFSFKKKTRKMILKCHGKTFTDDSLSLIITN